MKRKTVPPSLTLRKWTGRSTNWWRMNRKSLSQLKETILNSIMLSGILSSRTLLSTMISLPFKRKEKLNLSSSLGMMTFYLRDGGHLFNQEEISWLGLASKGTTNSRRRVPLRTDFSTAATTICSLQGTGQTTTHSRQSLATSKDSSTE